MATSSRPQQGMSRSVSHRSAGRDGQDTQAGPELPQGVSRSVFISSPVKEDKPRRQVKYRMQCQQADCGACKTIDRISSLLTFLRKHLACSPVWQRLAQTSQESKEDYQERLKQLFPFGMLPGEGADALVSKPAAGQTYKRLASQSTGVERPLKKARLGKSSIQQYFGKQTSTKAVRNPGEATSNMQLSGQGAHSSDKPLSVLQSNAQQPSKIAYKKPNKAAQPSTMPACSVSPAEPEPLASDITQSMDLNTLDDKLQAACATYRTNLQARSHFHGLDVASCMTAEALIGRRVKIFWSEDDAWYSGEVVSYEDSFGRHHVEYKDGSQHQEWLPLERLQVRMQAQEALEQPNSESLTSWALQLQHAAASLPDDIAPEEAEKQSKRLNAKAEEMQALAARVAAGQSSLPAQIASPGDIVWARETGYPFWPSVVLTQQEAAACPAFSDKKLPAGMAFVRYFGTFEWGQVKPVNVVAFDTGLTAALRGKWTRYKADFIKALQHADVYLQTGILPEEMLPEEDEDVEFESDDEEDDASQIQGLQLPMQLGCMQVVSLGCIEWAHPRYHDERFLWPKGFKSVRICATPASNHQSAPHTCEVVEGQAGPIFRVSVGDRVSQEGNATAAWVRLCEGGTVVTRGIHGPRMFGLAHPQVVALLQQLPGAALCERYKGWHGRSPKHVWTEEEKRARAAASACMQCLPEGICPVAPPTWAEAECQVCREPDDTVENQLLQCDACRACVHMECYGVSSPPDGRLWLCNVCSLGAKQPPACALCPVQGGLMKRTTCDHWCHLVCALWTPETIFDGRLVDGVSKISKARRELECSCCRQRYGACVQCAFSRSCFTAFHPLCARSEGLFMTPVDDSAQQPESDDELPLPALVPSGQHAPGRKRSQGSGKSAQKGQRPMRALPRRAGSGPATEHRLLAVSPIQHSEADVACWRQQARESAGGQCALDFCMQAARSSRQALQPGTSQPESACKAQQPAVDKPQPAQVLLHDISTNRQTRDTPSGSILGPTPAQPGAMPQQKPDDAALSQAWGHTAAGASEAACRLPEDAGNQIAATEAQISGGMDVQIQSMAKLAARKPKRRKARQWTEGTALGNGVRLLCFCRRHSAAAQSAVAHRPAGVRMSSQPAAAQQTAAAQASLLPAHAAAPDSAVCSRETPYNHALRRGHRAPEAVAAALAKRAFVRAVPYLVAEGQCSLAQLHRAATGDLPAHACHTAGDASGRYAAAFVADAQAQGVQQTETPQRQLSMPGVQSASERFAVMQQTLHQRITSGKSAIHGWGAFTKQPHKRGDMIIEYCGDLVRPVVADAREQRQYDTLVGAGTYIFQLSCDLHVDATRRGNMAHLLNHSCAPNCHSRNLTTCQPGTAQMEEHVIIYALHDLDVGQELTYDYRFNGEEVLPCNCGAATCRGTVNLQADDVEDDALQVLRHYLRPHGSIKGS